ncbi:hypothetical protein DXB08_27065 [Hungatella hathewayi]|nr:hypothetical protein DXB08_27065 [Hungatella hathewayi]
MIFHRRHDGISNFGRKLETGRIGNKTAPCWQFPILPGGSTEGAALCAGYRAAAPVQSVEAASLYSGVQRWKTSAQGKLMCASTYTGYYLTQTFAGFAASPPSPGPGTSFAGRRKSV